MNGFARYALYMVPEGEFYRKGADWLGWDSALGQPAMQPALGGLPQAASTITATPRKYGLHATIKPPFRLAPGHDAENLDAPARSFCAGLAPVIIPRLEIRRLGGFIAAVPAQPQAALQQLAAETVATLDPFRAALTEAELARRRKSRLTPRQEALLTQWGYPYVMEEFRFHLTLSGRFPEADRTAWMETARSHLPPLAERYELGSIAWCGERRDGRFELIQRYALTG